MNRMCRFVFYTFVLGSMTLAMPAQAQYSVQTIDFPNPGAEGGTIVAGINNLRQVSGSYYSADYSSGPVFTHANGVFTPSAPPSSTVSNTWGINNAGQVTGGLFFPTTGTDEDVRGFIKTGADYRIVSFPGSSDTVLTALNDAGTTALGWFEGADSHFHGFQYNLAANTFTQIDTPGNATTFLWGMNEAGAMVGNAGGNGILIKNGIVTQYQRPGASDTYFYGINNKGAIVGGSDLGAFVFTNGVYTPFTFADADSLVIHSLNDAGDLAGYYNDAGGLYHGFVATAAVPEPGSVALLVGVGMTGAGFLSRRRRKQSAI